MNRYVVATLLAMFVFVLAFVICGVGFWAVFPESIVRMKIVTLDLGWLQVWATPGVLFEMTMAVAAATWTFRRVIRVNR